MSSTIKVKRGSTAAWAAQSNDTTLAAGQPGIEYTSFGNENIVRLKFGPANDAEWANIQQYAAPNPGVYKDQSINDDSNTAIISWSGAAVSIPGSLTVAGSPVLTSAAVSVPTRATVTIPIGTDPSWNTVSTGVYYCEVTISGATITNNSKVDLQPDYTVIQRMVTDKIQGMYIENDSTTLKVYCIGVKPSVALSNVQVVITETVSS